ncbi:MAG: hypothetical protein ACI358_06640 [Candidatus Limimorpha sp.]
MKTTLQELLHAVNILGEDVDIHVEGDGSFAACPPLYLTPYGRECFKQALQCNVFVDYDEDGTHLYTVVSGSDAENDEAEALLLSLAGYCPEDDYTKWFETDDKELI